MDMDNSKNTNIYILSISAEKLANPNCDNEVKKLLCEHALECYKEGVDTDDFELTYDDYDLYDTDIEEYEEYLLSLKENRIDDEERANLNTNISKPDARNSSNRFDKYEADLKEEIARLSDPNSKIKKYKINEQKRDSMYSGSLPVSLDILKLQRLFPEELYTMAKTTDRKSVV